MENLRLTFLIFGVVAIAAVLLHGIWTIRKNTKSNRSKLEPKGWDSKHTSEKEQYDNEDEAINEGFDDVGVGPVRVISSTDNSLKTSNDELHSSDAHHLPLEVTGQNEPLTERAHDDDAISPNDPLISPEPIVRDENDVFNSQPPQVTHSNDDKGLALDDDLSINNTDMNFEQAATTHESEPEPQKLYGSVVTQPKPEFKSRVADSSPRPSQSSAEAPIPEPPPFLLKTEAASPEANNDINTSEHSAGGAPGSNIDMSRFERPKVDAQGRVEPEFKLDAESLEKEEDEKPIGLAAQARKLVSRRKKSVADKIRKDPTVSSANKAHEEQMRIDFTHEEQHSGLSSTDSREETQRTSSEGAAPNRDVPKTSSSATTQSSQSADEQPTDVLVLNVRAPADREITGAALLPMLLTLGFKFGEQDIFHRHVNTNGKGPVLFSLANLFKPGVFDIDNLENFSTRGLSLFMMLPIEGEAQQVFNMMHNAARKLAEEFGCQILDGSRGVLTKQGLQKYSERIREFERKRINR